MVERGAYKDYKNLLIWQAAEKLFLMVCEDVRRWPISKISRAICFQLLDSAGSIGANIAEGYGRGSPKEFEQFLRYCRGSAAETDNWLYYSLKNGLIAGERYKEYSVVFESLSRMLGGFIKALRGQKKRA